MNEGEFKSFLEKQYTPKSVSSRMSRARKVERILGYDLDTAVSTDEKMIEALHETSEQDDRERNHQNVLRNYYEFKNGTSFPMLKDIE